MTSSPFQAPPLGLGASARIRIAPPATSTIFNLRSAKNATCRASGDQNGKLAPSAPAIGVAVVVAIARIHSDLEPSAASATKARCAPSRDSPRLYGTNALPCGGSSDDLISGAAPEGVARSDVHNHPAEKIAIATMTSAAVEPSLNRCRLGDTGAPSTAGLADSELRAGTGVGSTVPMNRYPRLGSVSTKRGV